MSLSAKPYPKRRPSNLRTKEKEGSHMSRDEAAGRSILQVYPQENTTGLPPGGKVLDEVPQRVHSWHPYAHKVHGEWEMDRQHRCLCSTDLPDPPAS